MLYELFQSTLDTLSYPDAHKIIHLGGNIWLGNYHSAHNVNFIVTNNITMIVNCSKNIPFLSHDNIQQKYRIPVDDDRKFTSVLQLKRYLPIIKNKIKKHLLKGGNILIHCRAGVQRSATTVCYYLMKELQWSKNFAMNYIISQRYIAFKPLANFNLALED